MQCVRVTTLYAMQSLTINSSCIGNLFLALEQLPQENSEHTANEVVGVPKNVQNQKGCDPKHGCLFGESDFSTF